MIHLSISQNEGVYYYALFYIAAILLGLSIAGIAARRSQYTIREFSLIVSFGILSLIIGSKLMMFTPEQWGYFLDKGQLPVEHGKSTFGALIGALVGLWTAGKLIGKKESVLDLFAVALPLGMAIQGFGCLAAGCCHGNLTNAPWGFTYEPGSRVFLEQQNLGLIPPEAIQTLAVHPSQIYSIISCIVIAIIVWKTRALWKSPSGSFLFSVILYLSYRVIEAISSFSLPEDDWMGMPTFYWKVLFLLVFFLLFTYREWKYTHRHVPDGSAGSSWLNPDIKLLILSFFILLTSLQLSDWMTKEERIVLLICVIPLCSLLVLDKLILILLSIRYARISWMILFAFVMMSQKTDNPASTPASYTSINIGTAFGNYDMDHTFNDQFYGDCGGYWVGDNVSYHHSYTTGGIEVNRKKYISEWKSTLLSLSLFAGKEQEEPINNPNPDFYPPAFSNTLWSISPKFQYDARGIGLGIGAAFGNIASDKDDDFDDHSDYSPDRDGRKFSLQGRARFFSERYCFLEFLGGYDAGSIGDYSWQGLIGSRFNTQQWMLKAGYATTWNGNSGFVFQGQAPLGANLFLYPEFIFYGKNDSYTYREGGNRIVIGLEYRLTDKLKNNLSPN